MITEANGALQVLLGGGVVPKMSVAHRPKGECFSVFGAQADRFREVVYGPLVLVHITVEPAPIDIYRG